MSRPDIESIRARLIAVKNQLYTDQRNFEKHCEDDMQMLLDYVAELENAPCLVDIAAARQDGDMMDADTIQTMASDMMGTGRV